MDSIYKLPSSAIIHDLLEDEVIIANLDSGLYYSLRGSAVPVWQLLMAGHSHGSIAASAAARYESDSQAMAQPVDTFINQLCEEGLLAIVSGQGPEGPAADLLWPAAWGPLLLEKYDEMKNLLMLDPIHEVDEQGWPNRSAQ